MKIVSGREYLLRAVPKGFGSYLGDELFWNIQSAYTGTLSQAGVAVGQFFDGQELRGTGAWKEPGVSDPPDLFVERGGLRDRIESA